MGTPTDNAPPVADPWADIPVSTTPVTPAPAPDHSPVTQAWDIKQGKVVPVTANQLQAGIASGTLHAYGNQQVSIGQGVTSRALSPEDAAVAASMGQKQSYGIDQENEATANKRRESLAGGGVESARQVFLGIVDGLSLGIIHPTGEQEQIKKEEHGVANFVGNAISFALPGEGEAKAAAGIAKETGAMAIAKAAKAVSPLGLVERGVNSLTHAIPEGTTLLGKAASGAVKEGIQGGLVGLAYSLGTQATDALTSDHQFSGEEAINQMTLGTVLGSVFGGAAGALKSAVKGQAGIRALEDQQGLVNPKSGISQGVHAELKGAIGEMDNLVNTHKATLDIVNGLDEKGDLLGTGLDFKEHKIALKDAIAAKNEMAKYSVEDFTNPAKGDKQAIKAIEALDDYRTKAARLDKIMLPSDQQMAGVFVPDGDEAFRFPAQKLNTEVPKPFEGPMAPEMPRSAGPADFKLDAAMTPERRAAYEQLHGRPYEDMPGTNPFKQEQHAPKGLESPPIPVEKIREGLVKLGVSPGEANGLSANQAWERLNNMPSKLRGADALSAVEPPGPANKMGQGFGANPHNPGNLRQSQGIGDIPLTASGGNREVYDFLKTLHSRDPQPLPGDTAAVKIEGHLNKISEISQGQITAANALGAAERLGVKANTPIARQAAALYGLRQLAKESVSSARGDTRSWFARRAAGMVGADIMGHGLGPAGAVMGYGLGQSANLAAMAGKAKRALIEAGDKILGKGHAGVIAKTIATTAYSYNGKEPTHSLRDRLEQLHYAVTDEKGTRSKIQNSFGDLAMSAPHVAASGEDTAFNRLKNLSIKAPAFVMMGARELAPTVQQQRQFENYEAATWDFPSLLKRISNGSATPMDYTALNEQHPQAQRNLLEYLIKNVQDTNGKIAAPVWVLRQIEKISGGTVSLTRATDPGFVARQQINAQSKPPQMVNKPQAFSSMSNSAPLSTHLGADGRAPGNQTQPR